uniref:Uncharacterized protein n=1 Tax=Oryza barthii TaxID=65489 RepID=A0A0D3HD60_9ORYZ
MPGWSRHRRLKLGQASEDKEEASAEVELADKALREAPHVLHDRRSTQSKIANAIAVADVFSSISYICAATRGRIHPELLLLY